jgi:hypothetical protein
MEVQHKWNDPDIRQRSFLHHLEREKKSTIGSVSSYANLCKISFFFFFFGGGGGGGCCWLLLGDIKNFCRSIIEIPGG